MAKIFFFPQSATKLNSGYRIRQRTHTELSHREVIVLHNLFHRFSIFLRQHIRCFDHYYISRTRRG